MISDSQDLKGHENEKRGLLWKWKQP
ncbi:unnamed protein product, partial [Vitis vinifera]|uniref:Uncharacterized protein n=1 Tax=Vitis vinifera TaxID=29760 RepID=D7T212_VITVI